MENFISGTQYGMILIEALDFDGLQDILAASSRSAWVRGSQQTKVRIVFQQGSMGGAIGSIFFAHPICSSFWSTSSRVLMHGFSKAWA